MALTMPNPTPILIGKYHTFWRVFFVVLSVAITSGITAAVFLLIPMINNAVKLALAEGGIIFVLVVIVPSGILSSITLGLGIRGVWKATEIVPDESE